LDNPLFQYLKPEYQQLCRGETPPEYPDISLTEIAKEIHDLELQYRNYLGLLLFLKTLKRQHEWISDFVSQSEKLNKL